jgi:hypothetical protein
MIYEIVPGPNNRITMEYLYTKESDVAVRIYVDTYLTGGATFFFDKYAVESMLLSSRGMHETRYGRARITDYETDSFIDFRILSNNLLEIVGLVGETKSKHFLRFAFKANLSTIESLLEFLTMLQSKFDSKDQA